MHGGLLARHIYPSLVLVQPRKTRPCLTERLLMGRKESNKKQHMSLASFLRESANSADPDMTAQNIMPDKVI